MRVLIALILSGLPGLGTAHAAEAAARFSSVSVAPSKTSIYVGNVTLTPAGLTRDGAAYRGTYAARVVPFFFASEKGTFSIDMTDDQLARLGRGEAVDFTGSARNNDGEARRVEGRATPADAESGRIKVRILVSRKIELVFNTTYRFGG